MPAELTIDIP